MDLKISSKCFIEQESNIIINSAGKRIPTKSLIFCKKTAFFIIKDRDINKFLREEMDVISQAADEEFNLFKAKVRELDVERNQSILTSLFMTITGTRCKTRGRQVFHQNL